MNRELIRIPVLIRFNIQRGRVTPTIEVSEDLLEQIDRHVTEGDTREEFIQDLVNHYEAEGATLWEGYGGEP